MSESEKLLIKQRAVFAVIISENGRTFLGICQVILAKKIEIFLGNNNMCRGKCYKMRVKSRGETVILEI